MIFFKEFCKFIGEPYLKLFKPKLSNKSGIKAFFLNPLIIYGKSKSHFIVILSFFIYSPLSISTVGSITDLSYSQEKQPLEKSFFGPLKGSIKTKLSRNLRRGNWEDFFDRSKLNSVFDSLLIRTDLSFNYPFEKFSFLKESSLLKDSLLFLTLSYKRPLYDVPEVIKNYCYKSHFCFGEIHIGLSDSLPKKYQLTSQYSVYLTFPLSSKRSYDKMKYFGLGAFLQTTYPFLSKKDFQIKGIFSHFFDTAIYGSRYANSAGSQNNDVFSTLNQLGLVFSKKTQAFIPVVLLYFSHHAAMDYNRDFFQLISFSGSAVWSINNRLQILAGLSWGGDIFQHEFSNQATDVDFFNADETSINWGFSYSF